MTLGPVATLAAEGVGNSRMVLLAITMLGRGKVNERMGREMMVARMEAKSLASRTQQQIANMHQLPSPAMALEMLVDGSYVYIGKGIPQAHRTIM